MLNELVEYEREDGPLDIAGDFNDCVMECGSRVTNKRSEILLDVNAAPELTLLFSETKPMFIRNDSFFSGIY